MSGAPTADAGRAAVEPWKAELANLIEQARREGKWLWCHYQDLWFSPDELAEQNANGKFLWGSINWKLRDPAERLREAQDRADEANAEAEHIRAALTAAKTGGGAS